MKTNYKVAEDRSEEQVEVNKDYTTSVNKGGTWLKKKGKFILDLKTSCD
jgi:IS5 family transposase